MRRRPEPATWHHSESAAGPFVATTTDFAVRTGPRGEIRFLSPAMTVVLQLDQSELLGHRLSDLVHPDERERVERMHLAARRDAAESPCRLRLLSADGSSRWMAATAVLDRTDRADAVEWTFVDVGDQVRFEQHLMDLASAWTDVFDLLSEGVVVIDEAGMTMAANAAAADFLGVPLADLPGSLARAQVVVVDEHDVPIPRERLPSSRAFATGKAQEEDLAYRRRDGTIRWLHARVVPLLRPSAQKPDRVVILLDDAVKTSPTPPSRALRDAAETVLTQREREILQLLASGYDVNRAAAKLAISVHTARGHIKQLMRKLDARSQLQAVVFAARAGLIRIE